MDVQLASKNPILVPFPMLISISDAERSSVMRPGLFVTSASHSVLGVMATRQLQDMKDQSP